MFAIIKSGGKQYKVAANDIIKIEKLESQTGDSVEFSDILMVGEEKSVKLGTPLVTKAKVFGTVLDQIRDDKVIVFKKKRRHNYRRKNGHRQYLTVVQITDILPEGGTPKAKPAAKAKAKATATAKEPAKKSSAKATAPKKTAAKATKTTAKKPASKEAKAKK